MTGGDLQIVLVEAERNAETVPDSQREGLLGLANTRRTLVESAAVGALAFVVACVIYRVWSIARNVPFTYSGDSILHATYVDRMRDAGWYINNDRLGAPFQLDASDFPLGGENIHWLSMKVLGWVLPNYGATMNAYLLITYALVAASAYLVCRAIGLRRWTATTLALLFAFLPYHQWRGVSHLLRSGYYIVPFLVLALLWLGFFHERLRSSENRAWWGMRRDRLGAMAALALIAGGSDTQNAVYGSLLLLIVGVAVTAASRDVRPLAVALAFGLLAGGSLVVNNAPFVLNRLQHGANLDVADRDPAEQEVYSLRPAQLLLPVTDHRVSPLADLKAEVRSEVRIGEDSQALGLFGSLGLATIVFATIAVGFTSWQSHRRRMAAALGVLSLVLIAIAASQGWAFLLSIAGAEMLRTWNRTSLFIAFFALVGFALLLEAFADRVRTTRIDRRFGASVAAAVLVIVGVLDQVPAKGIVQSERTRDDFTADHLFYGSIEATLDAGAMVYQFPVIPFPEAGTIHELGDYEQLTAYLHTDTLRWSGGAMRGRAAFRWHEATALLGPEERIVALATAGFDGAVVYRKAFPADAASVEDSLRSLVGDPASVDDRRELAFYDLRGLQHQLSRDQDTFEEARAAFLEPVNVEWMGDLYPFETGTPTYRWSATNVVALELENPLDTTSPIELSVQVSHFDPDASAVTIDGPFTTRSVDLVPGDRVQVHLRFDLPPGRSTLTFSSDGTARTPDSGDERELALQLAGLSVLRPSSVTVLCSIDLTHRTDAERCHADG